MIIFNNLGEVLISEFGVRTSKIKHEEQNMTLIFKVKGQGHITNALIS